MRYAEYSRFALGNELNSYRLFLGNYSGNAGNDALIYHNNTAFSTKDKDNDNCLDKCAQLRKGEIGGGRHSQVRRIDLEPQRWHSGCVGDTGSNCLATVPKAASQLLLSGL